MGAAVQDGTIDLVIFRTGSLGCALRRADIREILPMPRLWRWPGLPSVIKGFFNFGGDAVPVLDAEQLFLLGNDAEEAIKGEDGASDDDPEAYLYHHMILLAGAGRQKVALLVYRVTDLTQVPHDSLLPVEAQASLNGCVVAGVEIAGERNHLLDGQRLLLAEEQMALAELAERARARLKAWEETA